MKFLVLLLASVVSWLVKSTAGHDGQFHYSVSGFSDSLGQNRVHGSPLNIDLDVPDLLVEPTLGNYRLVAYRATDHPHTGVTSNSGGRDSVQTRRPVHSRMQWFSVGQPRFVSTAATGDSDNEDDLFHFTQSGFYSHVETLNAAQRRLLTAAATTKYGLMVSGQVQIVNVPLSTFECTTQLLDHINNRHLLKGVVTNFHSYPLRMDFAAPQNSRERRLFEEMLERNGDKVDLQFSCVLAAGGRHTETKTLVVDPIQHGLEGRLFWSSSNVSDAVCVTRRQLLNLADQMYSVLDVADVYRATRSEFREEFVERLLSAAATHYFTHIEFDAAALDSMSTLGFDFSAKSAVSDLPSLVGRLLKVVRQDNRSRIVVAGDVRAVISNGPLWLLGVQSAVDWATNNSRKVVFNQTLGDQLVELNRACEDDMRWKLEGRNILPATLNVARLSRAKLTSQSLTLGRVTLHSYSSPYGYETSLYTRRPATGSMTSSMTSSSLADRLEVRLVDAERRHNGTLTEAVQRQSTLWTERVDQLRRLAHNISLEMIGLSMAVERSVKRCRICYKQSTANRFNNRCQNVLPAEPSCSGWSEWNELDSAQWTEAIPVGDASRNYQGQCAYQLTIDCQSHSSASFDSS